MAILPPFRMTGAVVLRDGELQRRSIAVADGRITRGPLPEVDLTGYYVLPGIIDLHGDAFERHIAPRPTAAFPVEHGIAGAERDAAAAGVTTAWMAQSWSWEGGMRGPDYAEKLLAALAAHRPRAVVDLRIQLRCETHLVDSGPRMIEAVKAHGVDYVVFNDHLGEALEVAKAAPQRLAAWAERAGRSSEEHLKIVQEASLRSKEVPRHLCRLAEAFDEIGVIYGSHDDPDAETRERYSMIGARIAEFPTSRRAAATAKAMNDPVLMGAPNVVRGRSHSGSISATELVREGLVDALVSDYHYPTLAAAAWSLVDRKIMDLPQAWAMISTRPAEILRLPDRGRLDYGRRADMVVVNQDTRAVEATIAGGKLAYMSGEAARRFLSVPQVMSLAAE